MGKRRRKTRNKTQWSREDALAYLKRTVRAEIADRSDLWKYDLSDSEAVRALIQPSADKHLSSTIEGLRRDAPLTMNDLSEVIDLVERELLYDAEQPPEEVKRIALEASNPLWRLARLTELGQDKAAQIRFVYYEMRRLCARYVASQLNESLEKIRGNLNISLSNKQFIAKFVNTKCRENGLAIRHPDTRKNCFLLAVNDGKLGRFVLEDSKTKKRSHTTQDIGLILPLRLEALDPPDNDPGLAKDIRWWQIQLGRDLSETLADFKEGPPKV